MADSVILVTVNNDFSDVKGLKAKIIDPAEYLREDHKIKKGGCRMKSIITSENECVFASCKIFRPRGRQAAPGKMCLLRKYSGKRGMQSAPTQQSSVLISIRSLLRTLTNPKEVCLVIVFFTLFTVVFTLISLHAG